MKIKNQKFHRISSTAIIYRKDKDDYKYLITRRSFKENAFPGLWTVPGGTLETDDYINLPKTTKTQWYFGLENSLRGEIKEEVNLKVGRVKYLLDIVFIRPDGSPVVILSWYCPYKSGRVKLDKDSIDFAWATYQEAKKYDLIEGILEEIRMVDSILKGKNENRASFNHKR